MFFFIVLAPALGSLICDSLCPRHVGRNDVPLLCGADTDLRYHVIRDVIVIYILWCHS